MSGTYCTRNIDTYIDIYINLYYRFGEIISFHRVTLSKHLLRLRDRIVKLEEMDVSTYPAKAFKDSELPLTNNIENVVMVCLEMIRNNNQFKPLTIFGGIPATYAVPASIVSAATSFYIAILSAYASANSNGKPLSTAG